MELVEFVQQRKREHDQKQFQYFLTHSSLPPGCHPRMKLGAGTLEILCETQELVRYLWLNYKRHLPMEALRMQRLAIKIDGDECPPIAIEDLIETRLSFEAANSIMTKINTCDDLQTLKTLERIYRSDRPMSLVSLSAHRNLNFNGKLLNELGVKAEELEDRDLLPYWLRPDEMRPNLPVGYIPIQLQEILNDLKGTSFLPRRRYTGWKESQYGIWTADIEVIEIQGRWCRLMTTYDFEEF